jgi:glutathione-dependent peroxiredoxin
MLQTRQGRRVPEVVFHTREGGQWRDVSTKELFEGRTVVLFALPGAFTPTCSSAHLPRYEELEPAFRAHGVDEVVCLSVNDAFTMEAWGRDQGVARVRLLPDGNGEFTRAMGMLVDKSELGFGPRSWRYSMLVRNGVIETMFIEPEVPGDPYEVSDADTMLRHLAPEVRVEDVTLFTRPGCPHCARAKALLERHGVPYDEIQLGRDATPRSLRAVTGQDSVPQVYVGGRRIGGADALEEYFDRKKADA